jgi:hypothetical protein
MARAGLEIGLARRTKSEAPFGEIFSPPFIISRSFIFDLSGLALS